MALSNTQGTYGAVARILHWLIAALVFVMLPLGWVANHMPEETSAQIATKVQLFSLHKTVGVAIFVLSIVRILWTVTQPRPRPMRSDHRAQAFIGDTVHWLLYGSLVLVPLSGWITHASSEGFAPILWPLGQDLPFVPKSDTVFHVAGALHASFVLVLVLALLLHVAGALKHGLIDRDGTLRRMVTGRPAAPTDTRRIAPTLTLAASLAIWLGAFWIALSAGSPSQQAAAPEPPPPQPVSAAANWTVTDGSLAITVTQLGQPVTGTFGSWTAAILFDETPDDPAPGQVTVDVDIASLSLGNVTAQALGPDFFDADTFPHARFVAAIGPPEDGLYTAQGTLTLKGRDVPVALTFTLDISDATARMDGEVTLDRRDFGIGAQITDERTLGFPVMVAIRLAATKSP